MSNVKQPVLAEYANNSFIERLPPIQSQLELLRTLQHLPSFDEKERSYAPVLRKHCVLRLTRFFAPMARQVQLAERVGMLLRQGYIGRNPDNGDFVRQLQNGAERIEAESLHAEVSHPVSNTAFGFALAGCSGVGKTLAIKSILVQYPQLIRHSEPFSLIQIVWLKLDCPLQGSPRQLCINFFREVDRLVGTDYLKQYGGKGTSAELMVGHMAQVAHLHGLGLLVIDEIQYLAKASIGPDALLNFLVTLINTIGIPIILIGTLSAVPLLQGTFRNARRANGLGSAIWDRLLPGKEWDQFVDRLWACQWTRQATPISDSLREVLYDESQGIVDILVKLYMLAQMRVISLGEVRKGFKEELTTELFRQVAREDLRIVAPMLTALRQNDLEALKKYEDLTSLSEHVARAINSAMLGGGAGGTTDSAIAPNPPTTPSQEQGIESLLHSTLLNLGVADDVAKALVAQLVAQNPSGDPLLLMSKAVEYLSVNPLKTKPPKVSSKDKETNLPADDLRQLVAGGATLKKSAYDALLAAGVIRSPILDFAA